MILFSKPRHVYLVLGILFCFGAWLALAFTVFAQSATLEWSRPIPISGALGGSRSPSIVADDLGTVYLLWGVAQESEGATLFVSKNDGTSWSRPVDVLIGGPRSMAMLDGRELIRLMFSQAGNVVLTYARADSATSARGWNPGITLNRTAGGELGNMIGDAEGTIYTVWFQRAAGCEQCYSIAFEKFGKSSESESTYRILSDLEQSPQLDLQIVHAISGTLYAAWDIPAAGDVHTGIKLSTSQDGGDTWSETPTPLVFEEQDITHPLLFLDKENNLVLVYNFGVRDEVYYSVSSDEGTTWSEPQAVPGLFASKESAPDDYIASATDTNGITHIIAAGRASKNQKEPGLYHVQWDGTAWTNFQEIYHANTTVEYPAVSLSNGNRLHVSFSTRDRNPVGGNAANTAQVWYTTAQTDAPAATRVPLATLTPVPTATSTPPLTVTPAPTQTPTIAPLNANLDSPDQSTVNPQLPIIVAIGLTISLLVLVVVLNTILRRRR